MSKALFTLEEANQLLPKLEKELIIIQNLRNQFQLQFQELTILKEISHNEAIKTSEEVFLIESKLEFLEMQAELHLHNIHATGAKLKEINLGLIDFPAMINGEKVLLCWKQGEKEIAHYHKETEGFASRRLIDEN